MHASLITSLLLAAASMVTAASHKNGPCTGKDGVQGVCISTKSCTGAGGSYISNKCPGLPDDIRCCTKPSCQKAAQKGDCRFTDKCGSGKTTLAGLCPGPDSFKCCVSKPPPTTPTPKPPTTPTPKPTLNLGEKILKKAQEQKGVPYHWAGGNCKGKTGGGFDCSGLVSWAVCQVTGRDLFTEDLRVTRSMYCASEKKLRYKKVPFSKRRAGDAVFFGGKCDCKNNPGGIHHVGLMMDDKYTMFNALKTGTKIRKDNFKNWSEKACPYVIRF